MKKKKQIIVIHGGDAWNTYEEYITRLKEWTYDPYEMRNDGWKKMLAEKLGEEYEVFLPQMPSKYNAKYTEWCIWMEKVLPYIHNEMVIVGHSLGANFVAKYLAENTVKCNIAQVHLVAGCYGIGGGFDLPNSLENIQKQCDQIFIYHSTDDPVVPYADALQYQKSLPQAKLITFSDRGHFLGDGFPEIVENVKKI
ncbi:MAG: alpha/beta hydrolase [Parcubacteria group bacterium]|jgi:hypothetical protein